MGDRQWVMFAAGFVERTEEHLTFILPEESGLILGLTDIYVVDGAGRESNRVRIEPPGGLGFMAAEDELFGLRRRI